MPRVNQQQWFQRWQTGLSAAREAYTRGVNNPRRSWAVETVDAKQKMIANFQDSMLGTFFEDSVGATGDVGWKDGALSKGVANLVTAASNPRVQGRMNRFINNAIPAWNAAQQAIYQMPKQNMQDSLQRVRAWMEAMSAFRQQNRRGG